MVPPVWHHVVVADELPTVTPTSGWTSESQASWYVERIDNLEPRRSGERMLLDVLPPGPRRVLDLGCGDGRLAALVMAARSSVVEMVVVDRSPPMLERARSRFGGDGRVTVVNHDLTEPIPAFGAFDLIVSGFAIHHLEDPRKRSLFIEVADQLTPGAVFANLEVVSSATPRRHAEFLSAIGRTADDPEDRLAPIEQQLSWMRAAGLSNVDCLWRWRGFALFVGERG